MITIPLLIIAALYIALMVWVSRKFQTWPARMAVVLVMLSPVLYWVGSYQYVHYRHEQDCAREGGLKVFIQPEKADRIRIGPEGFSGVENAEGFLKRYFPRLALVEVWDGHYDGSGTGKKIGLFSTALDPATTTLPKKDWTLIKSPLSEFTSGLYVLSVEHASEKKYIDKTITTLKRNGQLYATWTSLKHMWSNNGAVPIGWHCFESGSPEASGRYPHRVLIELILN